MSAIKVVRVDTAVRVKRIAAGMIAVHDVVRIASDLVLGHVRFTRLAGVVVVVACDLLDLVAMAVTLREDALTRARAVNLLVHLTAIEFAHVLALLATVLRPLLLVLALQLLAFSPVLLAVQDPLLESLSDSDGALAVLDFETELLDLLGDVELGLVNGCLLFLELLLFAVQLESLLLDLLGGLNLLELSLLLFLESLVLFFLALDSSFALSFMSFLGALAEFTFKVVSLLNLLLDLSVDLLLVVAQVVQLILDALGLLFEILSLGDEVIEVTLLILGAAGPLLISQTLEFGILMAFFRPFGVHVIVLNVMVIELFVDDLVLELLVITGVRR